MDMASGDGVDTTRPWRVGRSVGRTLYVMTDEEPSGNDVLIGMMDTAELAELVMYAVNHHQVDHHGRTGEG